MTWSNFFRENLLKDQWQDDSTITVVEGGEGGTSELLIFDPRRHTREVFSQ